MEGEGVEGQTTQVEVVVVSDVVLLRLRQDADLLVA